MHKYPVHNAIFILLQFMEPGTEFCVYWDFTLQDWSPERCTTHSDLNGGVICHCNHLTNFAVLVVDNDYYIFDLCMQLDCFL